jgi:hypothetical protein
MNLNIEFNKLKIKLIILSISSFISLSAFGQIFDNEQNPLSVKWRQINTDGFKIIYPTELEKEAQRMANSISSIYPYVGKDLKLQKTRIPIVFQNHGTQANGFVQLAPKKSQFYTTPPQQFDSQDWLNNLAIHELRHVTQFDKITGGKTRPIDEIFFGYIGISLPLWFLEGDAVSTETSLTNAGRGRQPNWIMPFRTSLLNGQNFSYSKSYFDSNKDVTPGYYQLGYLITSNLRNQFGKNIIDSLLTDIHKRPLRLYPFSQSLKKITGKNTRKYYLQTLDTLKAGWVKQDEQNQSENYVSFNQPSKFASSYFFPQEISTNQIVALKQTKAEAPGFVIIDSNKNEKRLFKIGYQEQPYFNLANNILVWDEIREDPRYKQRTYSVICTYNLQTKTKNRLSFKTRLFSPSLSADGKKIVAVQIDLSNQSNLVIIDSQSGKILETLPNLNNDILQTPALNIDASQATWVSVTEKGKSLWVRNNTGENINLISNTNQQLGRPIFIDDKIAFNAHFNGIDNIYEVDIISKKIMALTSAKYGAFNPSLSFDQQSIIFNSYQLNGYEIAKTEIKPKAVPENSFVFFGEQSAKQENTGNVFEKVTDSIYSSKPYKPLAHLFAFHSISPNIDGNDYPGLQLKSNDLLNNLNFYTGVTYNYDLKKLEYNAGFNFKAFYPVLSATYKYRPRQIYYKRQNKIYEANWYENYINFTASLPLSFNAYNHNYSFVGEVGTSYTQRNFAVREQGLFKDKINFPLNYRLNFTHQVRTAERDIAPKWAQIFNFKYFNQPFDNDLKGDQFAFESYFYFPGFLKNHSFLTSFNYQTSTGNVNYGSEINTGFGYANIKAVSPLQNIFFAMYRFPFAFPDWEIGPFAYIKNFRAGAFINYENIVKETNLSQPKTFGFELRSTMNLLRYQPLFDIGGRVIFVNKTYNQNPIFELLFNYNF